MLAFYYCIHVTNHSRLLNFPHRILWVQLLEECSSPLLLVQTVVLVEVDPSYPVSLGSPRIVNLVAPVTRFGTPSICFPVLITRISCLFPLSSTLWVLSRHIIPAIPRIWLLSIWIAHWCCSQITPGVFCGRLLHVSDSFGTFRCSSDSILSFSPQLDPVLDLAFGLPIPSRSFHLGRYSNLRCFVLFAA